MWVAIAAMAAATTMKASGQYNDMKQQKALAEHNQETANRNAAQAEAVAEYNATVAERQGQRDKLISQKEFRQEQGRRRLAAGSGGAVASLELLNDAVVENEVNLATSDYNTRVRAAQARYSGQVQAKQFRDKASAFGWKANEIQKNIPLTVGSTLLAGGAKAYTAYSGGS